MNPPTPTFSDLGVPSRISADLAARGITQPFEIQAATIADVLAGYDVCGKAPTGSGKTLAFGIPLIVGAERAEPHRPRSLVLAPTRELADQIAAELRTFARKVRVDVVYGGVGYGRQTAALRRGVDVLIACPGRLEDLIQMGEVDLADVDHVVLDEADRMADMGFMPAVRRILDQTASGRQTVLFSATLDGDVAELTRRYQRSPVFHEIGESTPDVTSADHRFWTVERPDRARVAAETVAAVWPSIVFCRTRHGADRLKKQLARQGVEAAAIHGGRSQAQRNRALEQFADGSVQALVATDVAARGIHVDGVASVIHFDPPEDHKAYVHRSGRTARAGAGGLVVSLVPADQEKAVRKIQRDVGLARGFADAEPATLPAPVREQQVSKRLDSAAPRGPSGSADRRRSGSRRPARSRRRRR